MFAANYSPSFLKHQAGRRPLLGQCEGGNPGGAVRPHNQIICISQIIKESAVCVCVCGSGVQCLHTSCWDNIGVVVFSGSL